MRFFLTIRFAPTAVVAGHDRAHHGERNGLGGVLGAHRLRGVAHGRPRGAAVGYFQRRYRGPRGGVSNGVSATPKFGLYVSGLLQGFSVLGFQDFGRTC